MIEDLGRPIVDETHGTTRFLSTMALIVVVAALFLGGTVLANRQRRLSEAASRLDFSERCEGAGLKLYRAGLTADYQCRTADGTIKAMPDGPAKETSK